MIGLERKENCCGCTACYNICPHECISMVEDNEGFIYPELNETHCVNCNLCVQVCPILNYEQSKNCSEIYAAKNKNVSIVNDSASGGVFFSIVEYILSINGLVYGAEYGENFVVKHNFSDSIQGCKKFQGSKYVQSDLSHIYSNVKKNLENGRIVLFSGTPCQVAGLNSFLIKKYQNLITCDIICHSVTSPKFFRDFIDYIQKRKLLKRINMRSKIYGWNNSKVLFEFMDGRILNGIKEAKLWKLMMFSGLISRPSCHSCKYTNYYRVGDISLGDFWGIENSHPDFFDNNGVSLLFINTDKGREIFCHFREKLFLRKSDKKECYQPRLNSSFSPSPLREYFWIDYNKKNFSSLLNKYFKYGIVYKLKENIRLIICKIK